MVEQKYYNTSTPPELDPLNMSTPASSRRVKREQTQLLRQSLLFLGGAVVFAVLFFTLIIPGIIRVVSSVIGKPPTDTEDALPPQPPFVSAPVLATSSAQLTLKGFHQKNFQVIVIQNGEDIEKVNTQDDGSFSVDVELKEGENRLSAVAINMEDERSAPSTEHIVNLDTQAPKIEITEPQDNRSIQGKTNQMVTVKGITDPGTKVYLNNRLAFVQSDGNFSTTHRLENGKNELIFKAVDQAGNQQELKLTLNFTE